MDTIDQMVSQVQKWPCKKMTLLKEEVSHLVKPLQIHTGGNRQIYRKQTYLGLDGFVNEHEWPLGMEVFLYLYCLCASEDGLTQQIQNEKGDQKGLILFLFKIGVPASSMR